MKKLATLLAAGALVTAGTAPVSAELLFYADFDDIAADTYESWENYPRDGVTEPMSIASAVYFGSLKSGTQLHDGVVVKTPDGTDGANFPSTEGPQGGQVMLLDGGELTGDTAVVEEGLWVEMDEPLPLQDMTWEIIFWLATDDKPGYLDHQNLLSDEWPTGNYIKTNLRVIGDSESVSFFKKNLQLSIFWAFGQSHAMPVFHPDQGNFPPMDTQEWTTVQFVFDYNDSDPANSTITDYLNGTLVETRTVDASTTGNRDKIWGHSPGNPRGNYDSEHAAASGFYIGGGPTLAINPGESRGTLGAIDAVAISNEVLAPGSFVLPGGYTPEPQPASADATWAIYR